MRRRIRLLYNIAAELHNLIEDSDGVHGHSYLKDAGFEFISWEYLKTSGHLSAYMEYEKYLNKFWGINKEK